MTLRNILLILLIFSAAIPVAQAADENFPADKRIKLFEYDENDIFTIYTLYGYQTSIEFDKTEQVLTISMGDRTPWQIVAAAHRLFIRPMDDNLSTNMTVVTNRRTYQFDLKSGKGSLERNKKVVYVARFTYPEKQVPIAEEVVLSAPTHIALPSSAGFAPQAPTAVTQSGSGYNYAYTFTGNDELAPVETFDDGRITYIRLKATGQETPNVSLVRDDGTQAPYPSQLHNGYLVVEAVHKQLALTYPSMNQTVFLYNETLLANGGTHD